MIVTLFFNLVSYSLPVAMVGGMWKLNSRRWNRLARAYQTLNETVGIAERKSQTVHLVGGDIGWNSYKGIVTIGVTRDGILLKLMKPLSIFHPPLLIPYGECHIEPRQGLLIGKTVEYTLHHVRNVKLIIGDDLQNWIEFQAATLVAESQRIEDSDAVIVDDTFANMQATG